MKQKVSIKYEQVNKSNPLLFMIRLAVKFLTQIGDFGRNFNIIFLSFLPIFTLQVQDALKNHEY